MRARASLSLVLAICLSFSARQAAAAPELMEGVVVSTGIAVHALSYSHQRDARPAVNVSGLGWSLPLLSAVTHSAARPGSVGGYGAFDFDGMFPLVFDSLGLPGTGGPTIDGREYSAQLAFLPPTIALAPMWQLSSDLGLDWGPGILMSPRAYLDGTGDAEVFIDFGVALHVRWVTDGLVVHPYFNYAWPWGEDAQGERGIVGRSWYAGLEVLYRLEESWWVTGTFDWNHRDAESGRDRITGGVGTLKLGVGYDLDF